MYGYNNIPPPWMWGQGPTTPTAPQLSPVQQITDWIRGLEELKKSMKEEKKDEPRKKGPHTSVLSCMLFMLLVSPITGPTMYYFFQLSVGLLHK